MDNSLSDFEKNKIKSASNKFVAYFVKTKYEIEFSAHYFDKCMLLCAHVYRVENEIFLNE